VWRAAGAVAVHTAAGGEARVVALSYGERGESGELWKEPGQTTENVKRIRATLRARLLATGAVVASAFKTAPTGRW
jgi:4-oxalomesaconate hydratase